MITFDECKINEGQDYILIRSGGKEYTFAKEHVAYDWYDSLVAYMGRMDVEIERHIFKDGVERITHHRKIIHKIYCDGTERYRYK